MDLNLALQRQTLVDQIEKLPGMDSMPPGPLAPLQRRRQALVRKLEQFDSEHPEIVAALQP
jgi:hypothetical protein